MALADALESACKRFKCTTSTTSTTPSVVQWHSIPHDIPIELPAEIASSIPSTFRPPIVNKPSTLNDFDVKSPLGMPLYAFTNFSPPPIWNEKTCFLCSHTARSTDDYRKHFLDKHIKQIYPCPHCPPGSKPWVNRFQLTSHLRHCRHRLDTSAVSTAITTTENDSNITAHHHDDSLAESGLTSLPEHVTPIDVHAASRMIRSLTMTPYVQVRLLSHPPSNIVIHPLSTRFLSVLFLEYIRTNPL